MDEESIWLKSVAFFGFQVGLKYSESIVVRITGCPNGCARPYMAEFGLVGDGPNSYQVFQMLCSSATIFPHVQIEIIKKASNLLFFLLFVFK